MDTIVAHQRENVNRDAPRRPPAGSIAIADPFVGHAQQAVEKSLKAVLAARGVEFPFTHDSEALQIFARKRAQVCCQS